MKDNILYKSVKILLPESDVHKRQNIQEDHCYHFIYLKHRVPYELKKIKA